MFGHKSKRAVSVMFNLLRRQWNLEHLAKFPSNFCVGQVAPAKLVIKSDQVNRQIGNLTFSAPCERFRRFGQCFGKLQITTNRLVLWVIALFYQIQKVSVLILLTGNLGVW